MITAYGDVPTAVCPAMGAGAFHFVQKPFDAEALLRPPSREALSRTDETRDDPHEIKGIQRPASPADAARARRSLPFSWMGCRPSSLRSS